MSLIMGTAQASDVGVFYYPGWTKPGVSDGWEKIRPYKEREPLLGWYKEGSDAVTKTQISWWKEYGVDYVAYDWYWGKGTGTSHRTFAIDSFIKNSKDSGVEFTLLWANHTDTPVSYSDFDDVVDYWIRHYFNVPNYKKINGMPVVFIFSSDLLKRDAQKFGAVPKELLNRARDAAKRAGFKGIYFVGSAQPNKQQLLVELPEQAYDALSAYNYQYASGQDISKRSLSNNYKELSAGYLQNWKFIIENSKLPYIVPISSGWDDSPWGGSTPKTHDMSVSTPETFAEHLSEAKSLLISNPEKTPYGVIVCCWNEFGEGSYVEPTKKFGFKYLEQIKKAFKD